MVIIIKDEEEKGICVGCIACTFLVFSLVSLYVFHDSYKYFTLISIPLSLVVFWIWIIKTPDDIERDMENKYTKRNNIDLRKFDK